MQTMLKDTKQKIDLTTWKRRDHYQFFRQFAQPYWGVTVAVNCTQAYNYCKAYNISFFTYYLYHSLKAANSVEAFRQRIEGEEVVCYNVIGGSITVMRNDDTFGFAYFDFDQDFGAFAAKTQEAIRRSKITNGLKPVPGVDDVIHYSVLQGIPFSSMQHAQPLGVADSIPKIVFGQYQLSGAQLLLPVSVHVHHALCDGVHVKRFFENFSRRMELDS